MARRKNTKRIDPRYFLHETAYRDEIGAVLDKKAELDEMAFSAGDLDAATRDTAQVELGQQQKAAFVEYKRLMGEITEAINKHGGVSVIDPEGTINTKHPGYLAYDSTIATLWRVLSREAKEKYGLSPGYTSLENPTYGVEHGKGSEGHKLWVDTREDVVQAFKAMARFGFRQRGAPALNHDEPYISKENAQTIEDMLKKVPRRPRSTPRI